MEWVWPQLPRRVPKKPRGGTPGPGLVVLGRKFCARCGRWRAIHEYHPIKLTDSGAPLYFHSYCTTCVRAASRIRYQSRHKHDPEWMRRKREYNRLFNMARRREAGVPERFDNRVGVDQGNDRLPIEPFQHRYLQLLDTLPERPTTSIVAQEMGYLREGRNGPSPDTSRLERLLGLRDQIKDGKTYRTKTIRYDLAVRLAKALDMDPTDAGV